MLSPMRRLPAAPSRPAVHPHISPAPPSLRLRRQNGRVAMTRTTSTRPVVCCSCFVGSLPVENRAANQGSEFEPRSRSIDRDRGSTMARATPVTTRPAHFVRAPASSVSQPCHSAIVIRNDHSQNADFPRNYSKREKKPFPIPVLELRRRARERMKKAEGKPKRPLPPPKNGMLVNRLIPEAYRVYNARILLINNLKRLMKVVPVKGCKYCSEIHVGSVGHPFRTCRGMSSDQRRGEHDWGSTLVEAVFLPVEAYHLEDRLGPRIPHDQRFAVPRIPALVELCIQAGVHLPEYPTKRRRKPVIKIGRKEFVDANEDDLPDPEPDRFKQPILEELLYDEIIAPSSPEETAALAEETLEAWETVRNGALRLMKSYAVRVCGYCPELHIGSSGHKARNCGAFKHQQRNGQHGWQAAVLDDLIPPRYVWHMPESGQLQRELKSFYGQAPAVVEICIQGGAEVPEKYKATMRLDIGIPSSLREAEMVV